MPALIMEEDELPDNFDQAYNWFTQEYSAQKCLEEQGTDPLLNDNEQTAFSSFLDNVLVDPSHATESFESRWIEKDFYRGFRGVQDGYPATVPDRAEYMPSAAHREHQPYASKEPFKMHTMTIPDTSSIPGYHLLGASGAPYPVSQVAHSAPYGSPYGPSHGRNGASGKPDGADSASSPHIPHGGPLGLPHGVPHSAPHGVPHGIPHGAPHGVPTPNSMTPWPAASASHSPHSPLSPLAQPVYKKPKPLTAKPLNKTKREFLTENEVRKKHVTSEKRRRDMISLHFKTMCSMVPAIEAAPPNLPKSTVLQYTYDYMMQLARENKALRQTLYQSGVDTTGVPAHKLQPELIETDPPAEESPSLDVA